MLHTLVAIDLLPISETLYSFNFFSCGSSSLEIVKLFILVLALESLITKISQLIIEMILKEKK